MDAFKRALIGLKRKKGMTIALFLIVSAMSSLVAATIVFQQSIDQTRSNLWQVFPPVVTIELDAEKVFDPEASINWNEIPFLTTELIQSVAELPYVASFDIYGTGTMFSRELDRVALDFPSEWDQLSLQGFDVVQIDLIGVTNPNNMRIETELYELVDGRTFNEDEMNPIDPRHSVVMIPHQLAVLNNLEVGDTIVLENNFYQFNLIEYEANWGDFSDDAIVDYEHYTLEIIGTFNPVIIPDFGHDMQETYANNGMVVPLPVVHAMNDFIGERWHEDAVRHGGFVGDFISSAQIDQRNIIVLSDAADVPAFIDAAQEILPSYFHIGTFSNSSLAFMRFNDSIELFQDLSIAVVVVTIIAAVITMSLVILLLIRGATYEVGVYLSLGEKKSRILRQMLIELLVPSVLGIVLALFIGQVFANLIGREMLLNEIIAGQNFNIMDYAMSAAAAELQWFVTAPIESFMENYQIALDLETGVMFMGIGFVTVLASVVLPLVFLMKLSAKDILLRD